MRRPYFPMCENKDTDQHLCFHSTDNTIFYSSQILNFKLLAFFYDRTGQLVLDLVRNPEDCCCFFHVMPQMF